MANDKIALIFDMLLGKNEVKTEVDKAKKSVKELEVSFISVKDVVTKIGVAAAAFFSFETIKKATSLYQEQEKAIRSLSVSLATTGSYSVDAADSIVKFASEIEKTTLVSEELILAQIAISKSFGRTNEDAKKLVSTAINLSSAMGISLESAVERLNKAYSGNAEGLKKIIPELKNVNEGMLRQGAHVDIISNKFKDFAETSLTPFEIAIHGVSEGFEDFLKEIGKIVVNSDLVLGALNILAEGFLFFAEIVRRTATAYELFIGVFTKQIDNIKKFLDVNRFVNEHLEKQGFKIVELSDKTESALSPMDKFRKRLTEISDAANKAKNNNDLFVLSVKDAGGTLASLTNQADLRLFDEKNMQKAIDLNKNFEKEQADKLIRESEQKRNTTVGLIGGGLTGVSQGAAGAGGFISGAAAIAAGPYGAAVGPLVQLLGMNKEQLKQTVRAFADGAVEFISTVIENIPVLITELINAIPRIIDGFLKNLPRIVKSLVDSMPLLIEAMILQIPNLINAIIQNIPNIVQAFSIAFISAIPSIVDGLIAQLPRMIPEIAKGIGEGVINAIKDAFKGLLGGGGGGIFGTILGGASSLFGGLTGGAGSVVESIGGAFGFSHGGIVPGVGNKDTVPIMATPGERVLTVQQNNLLEQMLSQMSKGNSNQQPLQITLEIGGRELSKVLLDISRSNLRQV